MHGTSGGVSPLHASRWGGTEGDSLYLYDVQVQSMIDDE